MFVAVLVAVFVAVLVAVCCIVVWLVTWTIVSPDIFIIIYGMLQCVAVCCSDL